MEQTFYIVNEKDGSNEELLINVSKIASIETQNDGESPDISALFYFSDKSQYKINSNLQESMNIDCLIENIYNTESMSFNKKFIILTDADNIENIKDSFIHKFSKIMISLSEILIAYQEDGSNYVETEFRKYSVVESPKEIYKLLCNKANIMPGFKDSTEVKAWTL